MHVEAGPLRAAIDMTLEDLELVPRIWERDHTVWQDDPGECANRLGWLDCPTAMADRAEEFAALAAAARADGLTHALLIGMGGSSLYPEVLATTLGRQAAGLDLRILDTTHPAAVRRARAELDLSTTLVVAASKSGSTIETRSHLERLWADLVETVGKDAAGSHVVAITDPGSQLEDLGRERAFRAVVTNPPDIGGRFSALSAFGLVPAALLGIDVRAHLAPAAEIAARSHGADASANHAAWLGAILGAAALDGRYQLTLLLPDHLAPFGAWIEQLVAESTGKHGTGLLPILDEPALEPEAYGRRRLLVAYGEHEGLDEAEDAGVPVVRLPATDARHIAAEVFRWELATAMCGAVQGINPFDQPDVQAAKTAASAVLEAGGGNLEATSLDELLVDLPAGEHVGLLAFVDPGGPAAARVGELAADLRARIDGPVTVGFGPRYLHSTGQFHKGGPDVGAYAIVVDDLGEDLTVPDRPFTFGQLIRAQAAGDLAALEAAGRRVGVIDL